MTDRSGHPDIVGIDWDQPAVPNAERTDVEALRLFADSYPEPPADLLSEATPETWRTLIRSAADEIQRLRTQAITLEKTIATQGRQLKALKRNEPDEQMSMAEGASAHG